MKVFFYSLGCKVNQYDSEAMGEMFIKEGCSVTENPEEADIIIVNSCSVTAVADQKSRQTARRFKRDYPDAVTVLTGCMPQAYPEQAETVTEVDVITGNKERKMIPELVRQARERKNGEKHEPVIYLPHHEQKDVFEETSIENFEGRTRAFIKVQDGCNRYCSYCIIPTSRGFSRSRSLESIDRELGAIRDAGFKEVVLVGINFCCYGLDNGSDFTEPIRLACEHGFERVRIGSLEFDNITPEAIDKLAGLGNFCPQFHMSLQSGSDNVLKSMRRHYTTEEFKETCNLLRKAFKDTSITTDIMVGFPGETDEDHKASMEFAKEIGFEKIHVFPYSSRPGTLAAKMDNQIPGKIKTERAREMRIAASGIRKAYLKKLIGETVNVLCETFDGEKVFGYTENYTPVYADSKKTLHNEIVKVRIESCDDENCYGIIEETAGN